MTVPERPTCDEYVRRIGPSWSRVSSMGRIEAVGCWAAEDEGEYFDHSPFSRSLPGADVLAQRGDDVLQPVRTDDPPMEQPT